MSSSYLNGGQAGIMEAFRGDLLKTLRAEMKSEQQQLFAQMIRVFRSTMLDEIKTAMRDQHQETITLMTANLNQFKMNHANLEAKMLERQQQTFSFVVDYLDKLERRISTLTPHLNSQSSGSFHPAQDPIFRMWREPSSDSGYDSEEDEDTPIIAHHHSNVPTESKVEAVRVELQKLSLADETSQVRDLPTQ
jgi:hypothetical protein